MTLSSSRFLLPALLLLVLTGCNKDFERIEFDPEIAIPLFSATSTLSDLFGEDTDTSSLVIQPDGGMMLVYRGNLVRRSGSEIFAAIPTFPGIMLDTLLKAPFTLENQINLIRALFTGGTVTVQVTSDVAEDLDFYLEFPDATRNGETLRIGGEVKYSGNLPVNVIFPNIPIAGYEMNVGGLEVNVRYVATRKSDGQRVKLPLVIFQIQGVTFSYLEGYFGFEEHQIERDTITMDIFKNVLQGNLEFADPRVTVFVDNSFGFPLRSSVKVLRFSNETQAADMQSPILNTGFDFAYPSLQEVGQVKTTSFYFDRTNSNIRDIFNLYPIYLDYQINAISNPDKIADLIGFTTDSSYFALRVQVELPLVGKANGFSGDKIYDVDFSGLKDMKRAELKLVAENGLPVEILAQATLLSASGDSLGVLLQGFDQVLKAAPVGADGKSNGISRKETFILADEALLEKMRQAKKVRVDARFSTSEMGQRDVEIRSTDAVNIRMGIRATLNQTLGGE